jgi:hypothetical protein
MKGISKARALPWTRWGRGPQTPFNAARLYVVWLAKPLEMGSGAYGPSGVQGQSPWPFSL